jgi:very-short-patch-repair endonuclease
MDKALARRRALRGRATDAERLLWRLLRTRQFAGLKFRRQHPVGPYIVDLYCADRRLAVELDGGQHFTVEGLSNDGRRIEYLAARGIRPSAEGLAQLGQSLAQRNDVDFSEAVPLLATV